MAESALAKKLRLPKAGRALILNPPEGYIQLLGSLGNNLELDQRAKGSYDFVQLFVSRRQDLDALIGRALTSAKDDAVFWVSYPKGSSGVNTDLNRDKLWEALAPKGIRPVSQVSIDAVWSALRFRETSKVGK